MAKVSITSIEVAPLAEPDYGNPFYAVENDTGKILVVVLSPYGALYFSEKSSILYSSCGFYQDNHSFFRRFEPGESLTISA